MQHFGWIFLMELCRPPAVPGGPFTHRFGEACSGGDLAVEVPRVEPHPHTTS